MLKTHPVRLKRLPIYRKRRISPKPKPKYGPPPTKTRYGVSHFIPGVPITDYNPSSELSVSFDLPSYSKDNFDLNTNKLHLDAHNTIQNGIFEIHSPPLNAPKHHFSSSFDLGGGSGSSGNSKLFEDHKVITTFSSSYRQQPSKTKTKSTQLNFAEPPVQQQQPFQPNTYLPPAYSSQQSNQVSSSYGIPNQQQFYESDSSSFSYNSGGANSYSSGSSSSHGSNSNPSYSVPPSTSYGLPADSYQPPITSYLPPSQTSSKQTKPGFSPSYDSDDSFQYSNFQGSYSTQTPTEHSTKAHHFTEPPQTIHENSYNFNVPTQKYHFELDEYQNTGDLYDTAISSYDVPLHFNSEKLATTKNAINYFDSSDNLGATVSTRLHTDQNFQPPMLPNTYDQEQFSTFNKIRKAQRPKSHQQDQNDFSQYVGESKPVETHTLPPRYKKRYKAPPVTDLNVYNLDDELDSDEYFDDIQPTTQRTTTTTKRSRSRRRKTKKPTTYPTTRHNLDTDELRDAYGAPSSVHQTIIRPDSTYNSIRSSQKTSNNFVLSSSVNNITSSTPKNHKYHSSYLPQDIDIVSIQKSQSHSYYAGTVPPDTSAKYASKRHDQMQPSKSFNVVSSGFYVADVSDRDTKKFDSLKNFQLDHDFDSSDESNQNLLYDDDYDEGETSDEVVLYKNHKNDYDEEKSKSGESGETNVWDGVHLPKNHKFSSRNVEVFNK